MCTPLCPHMLSLTSLAACVHCRYARMCQPASPVASPSNWYSSSLSHPPPLPSPLLYFVASFPPLLSHNSLSSSFPPLLMHHRLSSSSSVLHSLLTSYSHFASSPFLPCCLLPFSFPSIVLYHHLSSSFPPPLSLSILIFKNP